MLASQRARRRLGRVYQCTRKSAFSSSMHCRITARGAPFYFKMKAVTARSKVLTELSGVILRRPGKVTLPILNDCYLLHREKVQRRTRAWHASKDVCCRKAHISRGRVSSAKAWPPQRTE